MSTSERELALCEENDLLALRLDRLHSLAYHRQEALKDCETVISRQISQIFCLRNDLLNARNEVEALKTEISRLKEGNFTPEELQNLCHNLKTDKLEEFRAGCRSYQCQLFGLDAVVRAEQHERQAGSVQEEEKARPQVQGGREVPPAPGKVPREG